MTIEQHINEIINRMLGVKSNPYYASLLYQIINDVSGEDITLDDLVITSVAEHCTFPNSFNTVSNILTMGKGFSAYKTKQRKFFIIMSGSLIPLDNADYPRGFFYNDSLETIRKFPLWESKIRKSFPLIQPAVALNRIPKTQSFDFKQSKSIDFISDYLSASQEPYYRQVCNINSFLYNDFFSCEQSPPKIIFLSLEDVALKFLNLLIEKDDKIINTFIFNHFRQTYDALFNVPTCWNNDKGSFLFWYEKDTKLLPLKFTGEFIENDVVKIELTKQNLIDKLKIKKLYPAVFTSLLLTNIMPNLPTLGGRRQGLYLKKMIEYVNQYNEINVSHEINNVNWGITPNIAPYLNKDLKIISGIYLLSNPPTSEKYSRYILSEEVLL